MATTARWIAGVGLAAGLVAAALLLAPREGVAPEPEADPASEPPAAPATAATPEPAAEPEPGSAPTLAKPEPAPARPSFDLVRVTPEGSAVIAGRAEPGSTVTILADGAALISVAADATGAFVAFLDVEPSTEPKLLTLEAERPGGPKLASEETAALLPAPVVAAAPEPAAEAPAETTAAAPEAEAGPEDATAATETPAAPEPAEQEVAAAAPPATPPPAATEPATTAEAPAPSVAATAILRPDSVEVAPVEPQPGGAPAELTLASIAYGETGSVSVAGFAAAGAHVRVYVDDRFVADGPVDGGGRWALELAGVEPGVRRLRLDELRDDGTVARRIETPFQRDVPAAASAEPGSAPRPAAIIVQPGNTLWTLARIHYGTGVLYTRIYARNDGLIGDPDLIYPGQIFVLPEGASEAATSAEAPRGAAGRLSGETASPAQSCPEKDRP